MVFWRASIAAGACSESGCAIDFKKTGCTSDLEIVSKVKSFISDHLVEMLSTAEASTDVCQEAWKRALAEHYTLLSSRVASESVLVRQSKAMEGLHEAIKQY